MKKRWEEPMILVQQFVANEYVAACGDENKVYQFVCDAPAGFLYYYPSTDGKIDGENTGAWWRRQLLGDYHPCDAKHEASVTSEFYDGFVDYNYNGWHDEGEGVIVWLGKDGDNGHATKNLNMNSWTTSKS